nr:MAG TPA: hypothetical protein [Bacteriophage sp.]
MFIVSITALYISSVHYLLKVMLFTILSSRSSYSK